MSWTPGHGIVSRTANENIVPALPGDQIIPIQPVQNLTSVRAAHSIRRIRAGNTRHSLENIRLKNINACVALNDVGQRGLLKRVGKTGLERVGQFQEALIRKLRPMKLLLQNKGKERAYRRIGRTVLDQTAHPESHVENRIIDGGEISLHIRIRGDDTEIGRVNLRQVQISQEGCAYLEIPAHPVILATQDIEGRQAETSDPIVRKQEEIQGIDDLAVDFLCWNRRQAPQDGVHVSIDKRGRVEKRTRKIEVGVAQVPATVLQ